MKTNVTSNKTESKPKRPYWTLRRLASNLGKSPGHVSQVLAGKRKSSALTNCCIATVGFDRFAEMASPDVVKAYVGKTY